MHTSDTRHTAWPAAHTALPVIDLTQQDKPAVRDDFHRHLADIARDSGFFYLEGHGIPRAQMHRIQDLAQRFFALPAADKQRIAIENTRHFKGYTGVGQEITRLHPDLREQMDFGEELPPVPLHPDTPIWWGLQGPNQWPQALPELRDEILRWLDSCRHVAQRLLHALLEALGQPAHALDALVAPPCNHRLKIIHYPGQAPGASMQGVGPHKDGGLLTLLLQDHVGGLQVQTADGWIDVPPRPYSFVVNLAEMLELATNGYLRANVHRVVSPPAGHSRYTIAYFYAPSLHVQQMPLLPLPPHWAAQAQGPESDPLNPLFRHIGTNALKGRIRSHLSVAARYYPEALAQLQQSQAQAHDDRAADAP